MWGSLEKFRDAWQEKSQNTVGQAGWVILAGAQKTRMLLERLTVKEDWVWDVSIENKNFVICWT